MRRAVLLSFAAATLVAVIATQERTAFSHTRVTTNILYKKEIAQIFQRKCFQCHSENNLSMSFTTYELARPWARAIREDVVARRMPPWGAVTGYGHFANDASLTQREIDIILGWADGGAPSGVLKAEESIPPVYVPSQALWELGQPNEAIAIDKPVTLEANAGQMTRRFTLRSGMSTPRALKAIAFKPGDRRVVRYAAIYEAGSGRWLWTWTPWHTSFTLPADVVYRLPARAAFTVEIGYQAAEEKATDESEVGLYFSDAAAPREAAPLVISGAPLTLAPGASARRLRAELTVTSPQSAIALWPELGAGVTSFEVAAIDQAGVQQPLIWVKDVRPDWPTAYVFETPQTFGRGTRLVLTAYYDNATSAPLSVKPGVVMVTTAAPAARSTSAERGNVERKRDR